MFVLLLPRLMWNDFDGLICRSCWTSASTSGAIVTDITYVQWYIHWNKWMKHVKVCISGPKLTTPLDNAMSLINYYTTPSRHWWYSGELRSESNHWLDIGKVNICISQAPAIIVGWYIQFTVTYNHWPHIVYVYMCHDWPQWWWIPCQHIAEPYSDIICISVDIMIIEDQTDLV